MAFTLCTSGQILQRAGANANSTLLASGGAIANFSEEAEAIINVMTQYNWIDNYSSLNADVKYILSNAAASLAAMWIINYDMSGYTSRQESLTMLNVLRDSFTRDIEILKLGGSQDFINSA